MFSWQGQAETAAPRHKRAFVSYSHDSDEHVHEIAIMAQRLRGEGIDAWIDKYEQSPPEGWGLWCYKQIEQADFVLVVCTETYTRRAMREEAIGVGRGVTWESTIITNEIYEEARGQSKFAPVVTSPADTENVPFFLKGYSIYDTSSERAWVDLLRFLTEQPEYTPAPLGEVKEFPQAQLETPLPVASVPPPEYQGAPLSIQQQEAQQQTATLAEVIEGSWVVQIQSPMVGSQIMRIQLNTGLFRRRQFQAASVAGAPGWQAQGEWEVLPGEQLVLRGTQSMSVPFPRSGPYESAAQFFSVTPNELHGISAIQERLIWRRE